MTTETFKMCLSNEYFAADVLSSKEDKTYRVEFKELNYTEQSRQYSVYGWVCGCQAFKFRGSCKHIEKARPFRCGYHEQWGTGTPAPELPPDVSVCAQDVCDENARWGPCPVCGGELMIVRCAV